MICDESHVSWESWWLLDPEQSSQPRDLSQAVEQTVLCHPCQGDFAEFCSTLVQMNDLKCYRICDVLALINLPHE